MKEKPSNSRRRRRALVAREPRLKVARPANRSNRRKITSRMREICNTSDEESWRFAPRSGYMGMVFDQPFYSARAVADGKFELPFNQEQSFSCLLNVNCSLSEERMVEMGSELLRSGMRFALCTGVGGEIFSEVLNDLLECGEHHSDGRTFLATSHSEDPIEEVLEYFALPSGIAPVNLILCVGDDNIFRATLNVFSLVVEKMRIELCTSGEGE